MSDEREIASQIGEIDSLLDAIPDNRDGWLSRVAEILTVAAAAGDPAKANFVLGQIFEALLPMRERSRLEAKRARLVKELGKATGESV